MGDLKLVVFTQIILTKTPTSANETFSTGTCEDLLHWRKLPGEGLIDEYILTYIDDVILI